MEIEKLIKEKEKYLVKFKENICLARLGELICFGNMLKEMDYMIEDELEKRGYLWQKKN